MGNSAKRDTRVADIAERRRKALELRKAGATYEQISDQLGYAGRAKAWQDVREAIKDIVREPAEDVLQIELARLDAMFLGCWAKAKAGDNVTIDRAMKIMERRAKLLGLDKATELNISAAMNEATPQQARRVMRELFGSVTPKDPDGDTGSGESPTEEGSTTE